MKSPRLTGWSGISNRMLLLYAVILSIQIIPAQEAPPPSPKITWPHFQEVVLDTHVSIGYGVSVADLNRDQRPDILLADKNSFYAYLAPDWKKCLLARDLTREDNVCVAAADRDGDGKVEVAVGAGWNPGDTLHSGAIFFLKPPGNLSNTWETVPVLPHEPTVHRMRWIRHGEGNSLLAVLPLHGRGNKDGIGAGVRFIAYAKPDDPRQQWKTLLIDDHLHLTHNFDVLPPAGQGADSLIVGAKEGIFLYKPNPASPGWNLPTSSVGSSQKLWARYLLLGGSNNFSTYPGAGEVRHGRFPNGKPFVAAVEPMHGHQLAVYGFNLLDGSETARFRVELANDLFQGHALACGDFLGNGSDQVVVGWRGSARNDPVGIKLFVPTTPDGRTWVSRWIDQGGIACEDLLPADLNGDGRLDLVASGRSTRNLKIYLNRWRLP